MLKFKILRKYSLDIFNQCFFSYSKKNRIIARYAKKNFFCFKTGGEIHIVWFRYKRLLQKLRSLEKFAFRYLKYKNSKRGRKKKFRIDDIYFESKFKLRSFRDLELFLSIFNRNFLKNCFFFKKCVSFFVSRRLFFVLIRNVFFKKLKFLKLCILDRFFFKMRSSLYETKFFEHFPIYLNFNRFRIKFFYRYKRGNIIQWFSKNGKFIFFKILKFWLSFYNHFVSFKYSLKNLFLIRTSGFIKYFLNKSFFYDKIYFLLKVARQNNLFIFLFKFIFSFFYRVLDINISYLLIDFYCIFDKNLFDKCFTYFLTCFFFLNK